MANELTTITRYQVLSDCNDGMFPNDYHRIIDTKNNCLVSLVDDITLANGLIKKLNLIEKLVAENHSLSIHADRLANALEYLYQSGELSSQDTILKAKWGLGFEIENESEVAAMRPRYG